MQHNPYQFHESLLFIMEIGVRFYISALILRCLSKARYRRILEVELEIKELKD